MKPRSKLALGRRNARRQHAAATHIPSALPRRLQGPPVILCPMCHASTRIWDAECANCDTVFRNRLPDAVKSLTGYLPLRPLGSGGLSSVYLAYEQKRDRLCVIKALMSTQKTEADIPLWHKEATRCLQQEAELLSQVNHPNIPGLLDWVDTPQGDFLIIEYIAGLTLEQHLAASTTKALPVGQTLTYAASIADILCYLANLPKPVVHLDIKPANLILPPEWHEPVLVDFGGAVVWQHNRAARLYNYGTPGYAAPEQHGMQHSPKSDIYGLGATLYHLLTNDDPSKHPLKFPALATLPADIAEVVAATLERDPYARPNALQLCRSLHSLARAYAFSTTVASPTRGENKTQKLPNNTLTSSSD